MQLGLLTRNFMRVSNLKTRFFLSEVEGSPKAQQRRLLADH